MFLSKIPLYLTKLFLILDMNYNIKMDMSEEAKAIFYAKQLKKITPRNAVARGIYQ